MNTEPEPFSWGVVALVAVLWVVALIVLFRVVGCSASTPC